MSHANTVCQSAGLCPVVSLLVARCDHIGFLSLQSIHTVRKFIPRTDQCLRVTDISLVVFMFVCLFLRSLLFVLDADAA